MIITQSAMGWSAVSILKTDIRVSIKEADVYDQEIPHSHTADQPMDP